MTYKMGSIPLKPDLDRALKVEHFWGEKPINQNNRGRGPATADSKEYVHLEGK